MTEVWYAFEQDDDTGVLNYVDVNAIRGAEALAREDGKVWAMMTREERDHYERLICEALVGMGGTRV